MLYQMRYSHSTIYRIAVFAFVHHFSTLDNLEKKNVEESAINDKKQAERKVGYLGSGRLKALQIQDEDII